MTAAPRGSEVFAVQGAAAPLVGRAAELALLSEVYGRTLQYHAPQLVTVVGNQGVGKSRLVGEWLRALSDGGAPSGSLVVFPRVLRSRATAGAKSLSLFQRLLRDRFGVAEGENRLVATVRVRAQLEEVFADRRVAEVMHFLARFIDLELRESPLLRALEDDVKHHESIARTVLRRVFELDAEKTPLILAFDDLHHADDESLALVAELAETLSGSPVVIVVAARPDLLVRNPRWGANCDHTRIDLAPLGRADAEALLRGLLARADQVPRPLVEDAVAMTSGNPLFLEELVRVFHAEGIIKRVPLPAASSPSGMTAPGGRPNGARTTLAGLQPSSTSEELAALASVLMKPPAPGVVGAASPQNERWLIDVARARRARLPITVEEAVQARIGSLTLEERDLLEKASTFGNVFWSGALVCLRRLDRGDAPSRPLDDGQRKIVETMLADLVDRDYLLQMPDSTLAGESEYVFKHNLERDLVTRMTPPDRARRHHLFGAQWLETRLPGRSGETARRSAAILDEVGQSTEEQIEFLAALYERGGSSRRAAILWFAAGASARARFANLAAAGFYTRGLGLLDRDEALARIDPLHDGGDVQARMGRTREALASFEEMLRCAWLLDLPSKAGAAHGRIGRCYRTLGEYDRAQHHLTEGLSLFTRAGDERGIAGAEDDLGKVAYLRGDYSRAEERHGKALELRRKIGDARSIALTLHNLAQVAHAAGKADEAAARFEESLALRRSINDKAGVAQSLMEMGAMWRDRGEFARGRTAFEQGLELARSVGDRVLEAQLLVRIGETVARAWRNAEAVDLLESARLLAVELGDRLVEAEASRLLGETTSALGDQKRARPMCERALDLADRVGSRAQRGLAHRALGTLLGRAPDEEDRVAADGHFRSAVELLGDIGADGELAAAYRAYGDYLQARGDKDGAQTVRERADEIAGKLKSGGGASVSVDVDLDL